MPNPRAPGTPAAAPDDARSASPSASAGVGPKGGSDWPTFLGPTRDSKSPETGILTSWPENGLRVVWQRHIVESYGIGSVSKGRYFQKFTFRLPREAEQVP